MSKVTMILLASLASTSSTYAADLTASSTVPRVHFVDTSSATNVIDLIATDSGFFNIWDSVNNDWIFWGYSTGNSDNTFVYNSSGDIFLANSAVFINRLENRMGIGTTDPTQTLDVEGWIRLSHPGAPTINWDMSAYSDGFSIQSDNGQQFLISKAAPPQTLMVGNLLGGEDAGNVGIGVGYYPTAKLDVAGDIKATFEGAGTESVYRLLTLSANDTDGTGPSEAGFVLNNALYEKEWLFRTIDNGKAFTATLAGTSGAEFKVSSPTGHVSGTELYLGNGAKNVGGVWINASSRALKENIKPLSTQEALTAFSKLQPVTYNYKTDKSEKVVGFIAEDVPELVSINSRDGLSSMDMVAVLTKVVQEQDKTLAETKAELKIAQEKIAKLETMQKRLAKVESLLTNLALDTSNTKTEKVSLNSK